MPRLNRFPLRRITLASLLFSCTLWGAHVEPDDAYLHTGGKKIDLIVAKEYAREAPEIVRYESAVLTQYEKMFGYRLDDTLYQGFASSKNQVANAFSTQIPLNMQIDFVGGSLLPDYFATTSWIKTLLLHESAHNFQLNAKRNPLSRISHMVFKNTPVTFLYFAPVFPVPNLLESSFMLEGNAVLNESLYDNGGRLYSGAFRALTLTQAKAGLLTPARLYNDHLFFPYGTHHYILGGYFQLFLAQKYGIEKTNHYFLAFSDQWLPFFTNAVCRAHFGSSFETLVKEYNAWLQAEAKTFQETKGETIAFSKANVPLNSDEREIFFLISDHRSAPKLVHFMKETKRVTKERGDFLLGKTFKISDRYYTRASGRISRDNIAIGLFDRDGKLLAGSASKAVQSLLPDGEELYFDAKNSYDGFTLMRDDKVLGKVNSSVISDRAGNYYYFRQQGKERTLCRNDKPLFRYRGYYGKVTDVESSGAVWFIASTKNGSALYRYRNGKTERLTPGDDVVDARRIDDTHALLEVIRSDGIAFVKVPLQPQEASVYERSYFFEGKYHLSDTNATEPAALRNYHAWNNLHYSALAQNVEVSDKGSVNFSLSATFSDPLERNHMRIYTSRYDDDTVAGIGYDNSAYNLRFGADLYGVLSHKDKVHDRGFGGNLYLRYPWYRQTYLKGDLLANLHLDSDRDAKSPASLEADWRKVQQFGESFYPSFYHRAAIFGVADRGDFAYGARYTLSKNIADGLFIGTDLHYAHSDTDRAAAKERGILIDDTSFAAFTDPSRFVMPSLRSEIYAKEAFKGELSVKKVFNFSHYYFSLPLSLRREALYGRYRYFSLQGKKRRFGFNEYALGITFELLAFHKLPIPVTVEWMQNNDLKDSEQFRVMFDLQF